MRRPILFVFILLANCANSRAALGDMPFKLHRNYLIVVPCSVGNQAGFTAIIDTGTTETILDTRVVKRLSLATWADSVTALTTDKTVRGVDIPDLQLGPIRIKKLGGIAIDLAAMSREIGVRADVVIGMDVLRQSNFLIDYEQQVMRFGVAAPMVYGTALAPGARFALISLNVLGHPVRLQVDTGFNGLLLYGKRLGWLQKYSGTRMVDARKTGGGTRVAGVEQRSTVRSVDLSRVEAGNWHASHLIGSVLDGAPRDFDGFDEAFDGLFGPRLLGSRRVVFDFDARMLYWE